MFSTVMIRIFEVEADCLFDEGETARTGVWR
jgi:hypothetical protein